MITKYILSAVLFAVFSLNQLHAGCGSCAADKNRTSKSFLEMVPSNGKVNGKTFASCGMCNFMADDKDCSLAIKVGRNILSVKDVGIDEHGDSHAKDGYCHVIKKVYVEGKVNNMTFVPEKIELPSI